MVKVSHTHSYVLLQAAQLQMFATVRCYSDGTTVSIVMYAQQCALGSHITNLVMHDTICDFGIIGARIFSKSLQMQPPFVY